jgi:hypothetical protein
MVSRFHWGFRFEVIPNYDLSSSGKLNLIECDAHLSQSLHLFLTLVQKL